MVLFVVLLVVVGIIIWGNWAEIFARHPLPVHIQVWTLSWPVQSFSWCLIHYSRIPSLPVSCPLQETLVAGILDHLPFPSHAMELRDLRLCSCRFLCFPFLSPFFTRPRMVHLDHWYFFSSPHSSGQNPWSHSLYMYRSHIGWPLLTCFSICCTENSWRTQMSYAWPLQWLGTQ